MTERVLVIKLGALGDLVLCFRAFASIRAQHPKARIALLTGPSFEGFAKAMPWFDCVLTDPRPKAFELGKWARLIRSVRAFHPDVVYDFQGKTRQTLLFAALGGPLGPRWSGAAPLCAKPRPWPPEKGVHYTDFLVGQLQSSGVPLVQDVDLRWFDAKIDKFALPDKFVLFFPGCAPTRLYKRWPAAGFAAVARALETRGIASVLIGTQDDAAALDAIKKEVPSVLDLRGQTSLFELAALARRAVGALGNDTGPAHIAASVGARTLCLMPEDHVDPHWCAPKGPLSAWIGASPLQSLPPEKVLAAFDAI